MVEHSAETTSPAQLRSEVSAFGRRLRTLREEPDSEVLLEELEAAHEELRVAEEEVRTQQDQIREALNGRLAEELRHDRLLSVLPVAILVTDLQGVVRSANPSTAALLGVRPDRLVGKPLAALVEPSDRSLLRSDLNSVATAGADGFRRLLTLRPRDREPFQAECVATVHRGTGDPDPRVTLLVLAPSRSGAPETVDTQQLVTAFSALTRLPLSKGDRTEVLTEVARICEQATGPHSSVSVTLGDPAAPDVLASTSHTAQLLDGLQMQTGEGPCLTAWQSRDLVSSRELATDERWPRLAARLGDLPPHAAVAAPVASGHGLEGALNVYLGPGSADPASLTEWVDLLAGAVAAVLQEIDLKLELERMSHQLSEALTSRAAIDQAKGMIMAARGCGPDEAFAVLAKLSSDNNVKVREIAARMVSSAAAGHPFA